MKIDYETLVKVWQDAKFINFSENVKFDHINTSTILSDGVSDELCHLFFALSDLKPQVKGILHSQTLQKLTPGFVNLI